MSDQAEIERELKEATTDIRKAADTVNEIKPRLEALEGAMAERAENEGKMHEVIEKFEKKMAKLGGDPLRHGTAENKAEMKEFTDFIAHGTPMLSRKDVSEQTGAEGRHALPLVINTTVQDQLTEINPLRRLAMVVQTDSPWFRHLVNVKGATSAWGKEVDVRAATDTPQLEAIEPTMFEHYAYAEITQWAARDLFQGRAEAWLRDNIVEEFARSEGEKFISGNGTTEPFGLLNAPISTDGDDIRPFGTWQVVPSGIADDIAPDNLFDLVYSLGASYRRNGTWLMNSATAGIVRKMKDADGRYLWTDGLAVGQPATLAGYPVAIVEEMPDIAAGATPIAFGDIRRSYIIADLTTLYAVRDEVTRPGWIKVYMFRRLAGHITDTKAMRLLQCVL